MQIYDWWHLSLRSMMAESSVICLVSFLSDGRKHICASKSWRWKISLRSVTIQHWFFMPISSIALIHSFLFFNPSWRHDLLSSLIIHSLIRLNSVHLVSGIWFLQYSEFISCECLIIVLSIILCNSQWTFCGSCFTVS